MSTIAILLLLLLLQPAPPPPFSARWDGPTSARVSWVQSGRACLYRQPQGGQGVFLGCWDGSGAVVVTFGRVGPLDGAYRPAAGDVYVLDRGSEGVEKAPLVGRLYMAVFRG